MWLRDYGIDITCVRLTPYLDSDEQLFIKPEIIIPLPEAKDYIIKKESKQKVLTRSHRSSFSMEISNLSNEELKKELIQTLMRDSDLTPRFIAFLEILLTEDRAFQREEVKEQLFKRGIGKDVGQAGRYLSNISQFITKKTNSHLRQLISFDNSSGQYVGGEDGQYIGETKSNYYINSEYRELVKSILDADIQ